MRSSSFSRPAGSGIIRAWRASGSPPMYSTFAGLTRHLAAESATQLPKQAQLTYDRAPRPRKSPRHQGGSLDLLEGVPFTTGIVSTSLLVTRLRRSTAADSCRV